MTATDEPGGGQRHGVPRGAPPVHEGVRRTHCDSVEAMGRSGHVKADQTHAPAVPDTRRLLRGRRRAAAGDIPSVPAGRPEPAGVSRGHRGAAGHAASSAQRPGGTVLCPGPASDISASLHRGQVRDTRRAPRPGPGPPAHCPGPASASSVMSEHRDRPPQRWLAGPPLPSPQGPLTGRSGRVAGAHASAMTGALAAGAGEVSAPRNQDPAGWRHKGHAYSPPNRGWGFPAAVLPGPTYVKFKYRRILTREADLAMKTSNDFPVYFLRINQPIISETNYILSKSSYSSRHLYNNLVFPLEELYL